ncbi:MAG: hypothetical protein UY98_C0041G0002 [Candidatus Kaiserbacteria bacterium GW2011_GWA2_58_9]|nr:MAG: hypothetical protein UY98_C0041G0002 [Candidatus Kaiserbacteria bacterium GW2011_GWA2_58_9]
MPMGVGAPVPLPKTRMGRWKASKTIVKESWRLLMLDKEILWFPVISGLVTLLVYAAVGYTYFLTVLGGNFNALETLEEKGFDIVSLVFLFVLYTLSFFVVNFFQAGIMIIARARFSGRDLGFADGIAGVASKLGKLFVWSAINATVGVILAQTASRSRMLGNIVSMLLGAAWNIMTFFSLPALVLNDVSIPGAFKESASMVRRVWGETIIVVFGVGLFFGVIVGVGIIVCFVAAGIAFEVFAAETLSVLILLGVLPLFIIIVLITASALGAIFKTALYEYASTGQIPAGFSPEIVQDAISRK